MNTFLLLLILAISSVQAIIVMAMAVDDTADYASPEPDRVIASCDAPIQRLDKLISDAQNLNNRLIEIEAKQVQRHRVGNATITWKQDLCPQRNH